MRPGSLKFLLDSKSTFLRKVYFFYNIYLRNFKYLKGGFRYTPFSQKDDKGNSIKYDPRAEGAAKFLHENIWNKDQNTSNWNTSKCINLSPNFRSGDFTMKELTAVLAKMKRGKATGPDGIPMEIFIDANIDIRKKTSPNLKRMEEQRQPRCLNI